MLQGISILSSVIEKDVSTATAIKDDTSTVRAATDDTADDVQTATNAIHDLSVGSTVDVENDDRISVASADSDL